MNRTGLKYYLRALGIGIIVASLLMGFSQKGQARMSDEEIRQRAAQLGMTESQGVLAELATAPPESNSGESLPAKTEEPVFSAKPEEKPGTDTESAASAEPADKPGTNAEPVSSAESVENPGMSAEPPGSNTEPASSSEPVENPGTNTESTSSAESTANSGTGVGGTSSAEGPDTNAEPTASPVPTGEVAALVVTRGESSVTVSKNLEALGLVEDYRAFDRYLCDNGYDHSISTGTYEIPMGLTEEEIARIICRQ